MKNTSSPSWSHHSTSCKINRNISEYSEAPGTSNPLIRIYPKKIHPKVDHKFYKWNRLPEPCYFLLRMRSASEAVASFGSSVIVLANQLLQWYYHFAAQSIRPDNCRQGSGFLTYSLALSTSATSTYFSKYGFARKLTLSGSRLTLHLARMIQAGA